METLQSFTVVMAAASVNCRLELCGTRVVFKESSFQRNEEWFLQEISHDNIEYRRIPWHVFWCSPHTTDAADAGWARYSKAYTGSNCPYRWERPLSDTVRCSILLEGVNLLPLGYSFTYKHKLYTINKYPCSRLAWGLHFFHERRGPWEEESAAKQRLTALGK